MSRSTLPATSISSWAMTVTSGLSAVDRPARGLDLLLADAVGRVDHLALQVRQVDDVEVHDADACRRRPRRGTAPPAIRARPHRPAAPWSASSFACPADPTSGISRWRLYRSLCWSVSPAGCVHVQALALPGLEPAAHRDDVRVAHRRQRLAREQRADRRRRSTGRPACPATGRRPRSPARGGSWPRGRPRARGPGPTRTPRGRRSARSPPRRRSASTSAGVISRISARASRRSSCVGPGHGADGAPAGQPASFVSGLTPISSRRCWSDSKLSIAHLRRAGLISMPSSSSRSVGPERRRRPRRACP